MYKEAPYTIGRYLKHRSGVVIKLERYETQLVPSLHRSIDGQNSKRIPNYNFLYGIDITTNTTFSGLTKEFEPVNL